MLPQSIILLASCLMAALAGDHPDGSSKVSRSQDALGNYQFAYTISNVEGEHFRQEGTDSFGRVIGSYGLSHADGRHRVVDYVADKDGFRARIRSNEPGVENTDTVVGRSDHGLDTAATSNNDDDLLEQYGKRLKPTASRVAYVEADVHDTPPTRRTRPLRPPIYRTAEGPVSGDSRPLRPPIYRTEEGPAGRDSRQRNLEDYQPTFEQRPPPRFSIARPVKFSSDEPPDLTGRRPQSSPAVDVYRPPIDPNTAVRRPTFYIPKDTDDSNFPVTTTSRRPFIPPYGGFEDQLLSVDRYPTGVSMTKIHGGLGRSKSYIPPTPPSRIYGAGRYPSDSDPPRYPNGDEPPLPPRPPSDINPPIPPRYPNDQIYDPLTGRVVGPPVGGPAPDIYGRPPLSEPPQGLLLRAIPIPNGIRAVRVDPTTGRIYDRLDYPVYLREEGVSPPYDNNILIHNDDASDDTDDRRRLPGNYDIPLRGSNRPSLRDIRHLTFDDSYDPDSRVPLQQRYNGTSGEDLRLNRPTAKDLALINRHLSLAQQNRFGAPDGQGYPNGVAYGPPTQGYPQFDDDVGEDVFRDGRPGFSPYSRTVPDYLSFAQDGGEFRLSRYPRNGSRNRRLNPQAKESSVANLETADSKSNGTVSEAKLDVIMEDKKE